MKSRAPFIPDLAGLRGLAALWVLIFHLIHVAADHGRWAESAWPKLLDSGWMGVDLFFLLSGFVLMRSDGAAFARPSWATAGAFLKRRLWRIYPTSLAALALVVLLVSVDGEFGAWFGAYRPGNLSAPVFVRTALLLTAWWPITGGWNQPVWSLSLELIGYLAFPLLAWGAGRIARRRSALVALALWLAAATLVRMAARTIDTNAIEGWGAFLRMASYFVAGVLLQRLCLEQRPEDRARAAGIGLAALVMMPFFARMDEAAGLMPLAFAGLIYAAAFQAGPLHQLLASRIGACLGAISFPLYLIQVMPILAFNHHAERWSGPAYGTGLVALVASLIALAWLLHVAVERPTMRGFRLARHRAPDFPRPAPAC